LARIVSTTLATSASVIPKLPQPGGEVAGGGRLCFAVGRHGLGEHAAVDLIHLPQRVFHQRRGGSGDVRLRPFVDSAAGVCMPAYERMPRAG
jgi:hypothetical protein